jgi:peptidoglycan/xylan/chitin deacetylase (PgdA/CDA1 family)/glycosyltransferase involved in cell wall biosynthesis
VLATYNRCDVLARTLPTVLQQNFPGDQYEVILVVDGSSDGTQRMLASVASACDLQVIVQSNQGPAAARQRALGSARGEFVFFTDDDIQLSPDVLGEHLIVHRGSPNPCMVRGTLRLAEGSPRTLAADATRQWYERHEQSFDPETNGAQIPQDFLIFANTSVRRDLLERVGGFDVTLPFPQEGFELLLRLHQHGVALRSAKSATAYEFYAKSTRSMITSDARGMGRAEWLLGLKHPANRKHSVFAAIGQGNSRKRRIRKLLAESGLGNSALNATIRAAEALRNLAAIRRVGLRALQLRYRTEILSSGAKAAGSWNALERAYGARLPVLMYHHVGPRNPLSFFELTIEPKQFEQQVVWLKENHFTTITPSDWIAWVQEGKPLPEKPILLTFDDAYSDIFDHAMPILEKFGFRATVFVVTSLIGGMDEWNEVRGSKSVFRLADQEQIQTWAKRNVDFGSHTQSHFDLTKLTPDALAAELDGSIRVLGDLLGPHSFTFAYPFGLINRHVEAQVRTRFTSAFSVLSGVNTLSTDLYQLQRLMVHPLASPSDFALMVESGVLRFSLRGRITRKLRGWLSR